MNSQKHNKTAGRNREQLFHIWHRYMGITIAIFVIYLSVTGLLLNHSDKLELDKKMVSSPVLLDVYDIDNPDSLFAYPVSDQWISHWGDQLFFDDRLITHTDYPLQGAVATQNFIAVATLEEVLLVTFDGQLIERLTAPSEKLGDINQIGINPQGLVTVETNRGRFTSDSDLIAWHPGSDVTIDWAVEKKLPEKIFKKLIGASHSIHWERVLLDMHSGRVAGGFGVLLIDLVAVILILLALSGLFMWYARHQRMKTRK